MTETDPEKLAQRCESFQKGAKRLYDAKGDMWFFALYHHLTDCANALRKPAPFNAVEEYRKFCATHGTAKEKDQ